MAESPNYSSILFGDDSDECITDPDANDLKENFTKTTESNLSPDVLNLVDEMSGSFREFMAARISSHERLTNEMLHTINSISKSERVTEEHSLQPQEQETNKEEFLDKNSSDDSSWESIGGNEDGGGDLTSVLSEVFSSSLSETTSSKNQNGNDRIVISDSHPTLPNAIQQISLPQSGLPISPIARLNDFVDEEAKNSPTITHNVLQQDVDISLKEDENVHSVESQNGIASSALIQDFNASLTDEPIKESTKLKIPFNDAYKALQNYVKNLFQRIDAKLTSKVKSNMDL